MLRKAAAVLSGATALTWSLSAAALGDVTIYDNAQGVPIGGRAAGMGGAYTALACDEGALHYNPASLSCAAASHLELTANAYVIQGMRATGALGPGENVTATTFHSIPSIVGAVRILSEGSERTYFDTYPQRLTFGFTVSVPRTIALKMERPKASERNYVSSSIREDLTVGSLGLGYQFNKEVSIGIAFGGVLRTSERHSSALLVRDQPVVCALGGCNDFIATAEDRSSFAVGTHAKIGALVRPYKNLSFGLVLSAPSLHVYGHANDSSTISRADANGYTAIPIRATGSSEVGLPARIAFGFAFVKRRYTFSGDLSVNLPHRVRLAYDMKAEAIDGLATPAVPDRVLHPGVQPNLNLGASVPFGTTKEVNIGFFTDLSSVSQEDIDNNGLGRVHMFGSSITLGLLGKQARAWIGASAEIGHTTLKVPGRSFTYERVAPLPAGNLPSDNEASLVRWTVAGILGSNYSFLD
jgi:long-subunit fatty acid transport protein